MEITKVNTTSVKDEGVSHEAVRLREMGETNAKQGVQALAPGEGEGGGASGRRWELEAEGQQR